MKRSLAKRTGFTLVEVAVSLGLISFITAGGIYIYLTVIRSANRASSIVEVDGVASLMMETMVREIRSAGCVSDTAAELSILNSRCTAAEVTFRRVADGSYFNLERDPASGESSTLNPESVTVTELSFSAGSGSITTTTKAIQITLGVAIRNPVRADYQAEVTLRETVTLRNY